jgi:predicted ATPase
MSITDVLLRPLDRGTVAALAADTLTSGEEEVRELADLVFEKTHGNPFFAQQFMATLSEQGLLKFDASEGAWRWDAEGIRAANVTDNVVDLMVGKLRRLAPATQQALMLASCIGHHFDLRSLATVTTVGERSLAETAGALWEAMREGYVVPLDGDYRLLEGMSGSAELPPDFNVRYRFLHDRILHAAYTLVEPARKRELHLSVGRLLR